VRAEAAAQLARSGTAWPHALELAQKDSWPLVRAAATRGLAARPEARAQLEQLVGDPAARVRVAAIDALAAQQARDAWPAIGPHLESATESPSVQSTAVSFARELCVSAAREALITTVRRAYRPEAAEDEQRLAVEALHALHDLGGAASADAKNLATRPEAPPGLTKAHAKFRAPMCEKPAGAAP
jgi:hypothetical protein